MPQPITLKPHLSTEELYRRYRTCPRPQEQARWRALHLISQGEQANRAARRMGRASGWITQLARRYNERGAEAVPNQQGAQRAGGKPHLNTQAAHELDIVLRSAAPDGGLWTAPKVAAWMAARTGPVCASGDRVALQAPTRLHAASATSASSVSCHG